MDWHEIERRLVERAEEVCRHLLPNGRRVAQEWCVGSLAGEAGDSLKVNLAGKVGVWADFAADKRGKTLMSLWCSVRGEAFRVCIKEAKGWLGVPEDYYERRIRPAGNSQLQTPNREAGNENEWTVEQQWGRCEGLTEDGPVWRYLVEERRIEEGVLEVFGVRELALAGNRWAMVFPYYAPHEREEESQVEAAIRAQAQERPKGETAKDLTGGNEGTKGAREGRKRNGFRVG